MSDVTPNYAIERKKLQVQIGQMRQNILASELRQLQLESELAQIAKNVEASHATIAEYEAAIVALPEE